MQDLIQRVRAKVASEKGKEGQSDRRPKGASGQRSKGQGQTSEGKVTDVPDEQFDRRIKGAKGNVTDVSKWQSGGHAELESVCKLQGTFLKLPCP